MSRPIAFKHQPPLLFRPVPNATWLVTWRSFSDAFVGQLIFDLGHSTDAFGIRVPIYHEATMCQRVGTEVSAPQKIVGYLLTSEKSNFPC